jgi:phosphoribosylglycinamide formyltransferase-1
MAEARCRVVVLISGTGTNLQALLDTFAAADSPAEIVGVVSNRPGVGGLERAARAGVATAVVDHRDFPDRAAFDAALLDKVASFAPDLVALAGFMRILGAEFVRHFAGRLINIHPSLLPRYPGLDTHKRAIEAGDSHGGATVHFVTEELDGGPAIVQAAVPILPDDDPGALAARVLTVEHQIYPLAVEWFASGRLALRDGQALLDRQPLPAGGYRFEE